MSIYRKMGIGAAMVLLCSAAFAAQQPTPSAKAAEVQYACTQATKEALREMANVDKPVVRPGETLQDARADVQAYNDTIAMIVHSERIACDAAAGITVIAPTTAPTH